MVNMRNEVLNYWDAMAGLNAARRAGDTDEASLRLLEIEGIAVNTAWPRLGELCEKAFSPAGGVWIADAGTVRIAPDIIA